MAKLFYTLEEACDRLGKTEDEVREMSKSGQLEEMRDGDQALFKRQQIDLLCGEDEQSIEELDLDLSSTGSSVGVELSDSMTEGSEEEPDPIGDDEASPASSGYGLSDSGTSLGLGGSSASGLDLSGSGFGFDLGDSGSAAGLDLGDSSADSGLGIAFDGGEDDESAETRVADAVDEELSLESIGSGSGLLDLTRESDDTSLGAELLDEVWEGGESGEFGVSASGLFESTDPEQASQVPSEVPMGLAVATVALAYDGKWSGTGIGLLLGSMIALVAVSVMLITTIMGVTPKLSSMITGDFMIWVGGFAGFAIVAGLIGMFLGKASE
jgi:excisionase family DNA binding protein